MLTFVTTPIGNLQDITLRALDAIFEADVILCEDTRVSKRLIELLSQKFDRPKKEQQFISLHSHNEDEKLKSFDNRFFEKNVIYMSDAGMPCISDPGSKLVAYAQEHTIEYDFLPGANAATLAYGMSGFEETSFTFYGFLPIKNDKRLTELEKIMSSDTNTILYESPHRIEKLIDEIVAIDGTREVFVAKELTKLHQFTLKTNGNKLKESIKNYKGEWVVIIQSKPQTTLSISHQEIKKMDIPPKVKAKLLSFMDGIPTKEWYKELTN